MVTDPRILNMSSDQPYYQNIELFPELVWKINLGSNLNDKGKEVITEALKDNRVNPLGNTTTKNSYLLEHPDLKDFKNECLKHCRNYFKFSFHPDDPDSLYMTQSWANLTTKAQSHRTHSHANSILSAVFYVEACDKDKIIFHHPWRGQYSQIMVHSDTYDRYNALSWELPVVTNDLLIFRSTLHHSVPYKEHSGDRISLAFNTFFNELGNDESLTQLNVQDWEQIGWNRIPVLDEKQQRTTSSNKTDS